MRRKSGERKGYTLSDQVDIGIVKCNVALQKIDTGGVSPSDIIRLKERCQGIVWMMKLITPPGDSDRMSRIKEIDFRISR